MFGSFVSSKSILHTMTKSSLLLSFHMLPNKPFFNPLQYRSFGKGSMKTNKSAAKRFRIKGNGDLRRQHSGKGHNTGYLTRQRKNRLSTSTAVKGKNIQKNIKKRLLCIPP